VVGEVTKDSADYQKLVAQTSKLSRKYGQSVDDIAKAQLELAKAGKTVPEILKLSNAVITLGAATDTTVGGRNGAAEILVNVMQAFNAGVGEATYYADVLTAAANRSTIDV